MSQLPPELHDVQLFNLAIPGSHDSMSYDLDINSRIIEPDRLKRFSRIYCLRKTVFKWAVTQEENITKQLDTGIRYFDLRIARKSNDQDPTRLYFYHGLYTQTDVETALRMVHDWTQKHPREVIILALSHFKGFDKKNEQHLHNHLINFIKTLFGPKLFIKTDIPTLKRCWDQGRTVIVSYDYPASQHPELWKAITYYYGDSMDTTKIETKLNQLLKKQRPYPQFIVCGLNLTLPEDARILKYVLRFCDNFINVIGRTLPRLLRWVKKEAGKLPMNIVAADLVTRYNFVPTIVELNFSKPK